MADQWYVGRDGQKSGPYSPDQMRQMAASGQLQPADVVWKKGMADWVPATQVPGLLPPAVAPASGPARRRAGAPPAPRSGGQPPMPTPAVVSGSAPVAAPQSLPAPGAAAGGSYSFGAAFSLANSAFASKWGGLALLGLVMFGVFFGLSLPGNILSVVGGATGDEGVAGLLAVVGSCIGQVLVLVIGGPFYAGVVIAGANAVTDKPQVSDLFIGFKRYGQVLLASFMAYLCGIGVLLVSLIPLLPFALVAGFVGSGSPRGSGPGLAAAIMGLGVLLTVVLMLVGSALVTARIGFAPAIVADPTLGQINAMDAFRKSWSMTNSKTGLSLMGLFIVASLLAGFSVVLLCVGYVIVGLPLLAVMMGSAYTLLFRAQRPEASLS